MVRRANLAWDACNCILVQEWSCLGHGPHCPPSRGSSAWFDWHSTTHVAVPIFMVWAMYFMFPAWAGATRRRRRITAAVAFAVHVGEDILANFGAGCCTAFIYWDNDSAQNFMGDQLCAAVGATLAMCIFTLCVHAARLRAERENRVHVLTDIGYFAPLFAVGSIGALAVLAYEVSMRQLFGGLIVIPGVCAAAAAFMTPLCVGIYRHNPFGCTPWRCCGGAGYAQLATTDDAGGAVALDPRALASVFKAGVA